MHTTKRLHPNTDVGTCSKLLRLHAGSGLDHLRLAHLAAKVEKEARGERAGKEIIEIGEEKLISKGCDVKHDNASDAKEYNALRSVRGGRMIKKTYKKVHRPVYIEGS